MSAGGVMRTASERGVLLSGLVVDAAGLAMVMSRRTATGAIGSRYYVSPATSSDDRACQRIPAARLDRCVVGVLRRVGLLQVEWQPADLAAVLRRVVVYSDYLELLLNSRTCLALWRAQQPGMGRASLTKVLAAMEGVLASDEDLTEVGTTLCLSAPRYSRNRCVRDRGRQRGAARSLEKEGVNTIT
jgi:hypothetical protein